MTALTQPVVIGLGRGFNGFYCPEAKFHLIGGLRPVASYTAATLSEDVKRGIRAGSLIDVNKVLSEDDIKPDYKYGQHMTSGDRKKAIQIQVEEALDTAKPDADKSEKEKLEEETGELLSETDIATGTSKVLIAYINKTEGISMESLGLTGSSRVGDIRNALNAHFGYAEINTATTQED